MGKRSRAAGARFELKVRKDLEEKGWITDKWTKNVDLETRKTIPAKRKFNPFKKVLGIGTGFPDFIAFRPVVDPTEKKRFHNYNVIGVESKMRGILDKKEKEKCRILLENNTFKDIYLARKGEKLGEIEYINFLTKEKDSLF